MIHRVLFEKALVFQETRFSDGDERHIEIIETPVSVQNESLGKRIVSLDQKYQESQGRGEIE